MQKSLGPCNACGMSDSECWDGVIEGKGVIGDVLHACCEECNHLRKEAEA